MREYWNKNKWLLVVTCIIILLPILAGVILWNDLPTNMPMHWGVNGQVDGYAPKAVAVFVTPAALTAFQLLCFFVSGKDPKAKDNTPKAMSLVLWLIPIISLAMSTFTYLVALEIPVSVSVVMPLLFGFLFVVIGNYLPKCKQSYTIGIKIPWTLDNEENWNATHRLAGKVWVICGLLTFPCALLPTLYGCIAMAVLLVVMLAIPTVYSYQYYKKQKGNK